MTSEILVEATRGGAAESRHRGQIAVVRHDGVLIASAGSPGERIFARSAAKPLQTIPLLERGGAERFGLTEADLALCCASHGGEPQHTGQALALLRKLGLGADALDCGVHEPFYKPAADALLRAGEAPSPLHNNCSGKHAGMLALALLMKAPLAGYIAAEHPVQREMLRVVAAMCGLPPERVALGVDGCGVPVFGVPLASLAFAYARLGRPEALPPQRAEACRRIARAIGREPFYVAGTARFDTHLAEATGGRVIGKMGAEGVYAAAVPELGIGLALKIEDGAERASYPAAVDALRQLGALTETELARLASFHRPAVWNRHGDAVGELRPRFTLRGPDGQPYAAEGNR